jgi:hypothetical protein
LSAGIAGGGVIPDPAAGKGSTKHRQPPYKAGEPTTCMFEYSGWLTEANHLGNVAYRTGKKLEWDAEKLTATNAPEADRFIRREYREGWGRSLKFKPSL